MRKPQEPQKWTEILFGEKSEDECCKLHLKTIALGSFALRKHLL